MKFNLKGGALLIGSLFWQDDLVRGSGDEIRKTWRQSRLKMNEVVNVQVPIRYGRFSSMSNTYTMIFDKEAKAGIAKAVPFSNTDITHFGDIKTEVMEISKAEGQHDESFIKNERAWCVCTVLINPKIESSTKAYILSQWQNELMSNPAGYQYFKSNTQRYCVHPTGELDSPWPDEAVDFDFLIATATKEKKRDGVNEISPLEVAKYVQNRPYFYPNVENGISTFQDEEIKRHL
ncbi:hypothetical protein JMN32_19095 [Fulvivirga sp. 29W222]|uniref:Uncharacterized protein n=1 Tax=Fulvivirga marina TaxID=2494733 RepID=A0A937KFQ7_9BACT|nr:hypothetical protein [Fulvivirga marina]MBL6448428.1 hypothetical protein [Fulvivirga marina]